MSAEQTSYWLDGLITAVLMGGLTALGGVPLFRAIAETIFKVKVAFKELFWPVIGATAAYWVAFYNLITLASTPDNAETIFWRDVIVSLGVYILLFIWLVRNTAVGQLNFGKKTLLCLLALPTLGLPVILLGALFVFIWPTL